MGGGEMFELFAVVIAIVALVVARKALNEAASLRAYLNAIEARGLQVPPAPLASAEMSVQTRRSETVSPPTSVAPEPPLRQTPPSAPDEALAATGAMPPPLRRTDPGFEERIGDRKSVV